MSDQPAQQSPAVGRTFSHYRLLARLGEGGMGTVFRAADLSLGRQVALKFLSPHLASDPEARRRFLHEARAAAALDHGGICTVHEVGEAEGQPFIAMSLLEGRTLKARIADGPLPLAEAMEIARQVAEALQEAHDRGVVHRDVKPANVMLTPRGQVKVLDFGLAQLAGASRLTRTGTVAGTAAYMSPEQARGEKADARTDVWSLGVVLYEMVAGRRPFAAEHESALLHAIQTREPEPLSALRTGVPLELDRIVAKCLAKAPARRYGHADELAADLGVLAQLAGADQPTRTAPAPGPGARRGRPRSRPAAPLLAAGLGLALIAILAAPRLSRHPSAPAATATIQSLAVLPFANLGGDPGQEYLVEGMHEALITNLSRAGDLKVISRTSVLRYEGAGVPLPRIAAELKVDGIIEGSILRAGDRVRIDAHLVDARTDRQIWAQSYERSLDEILQLQRDVAGEIVAEVGAALRPAPAVAGAAPSVAPAAYEAYARGRYHFNRRTRDDMLEAIAQFRRAIQIAPAFAEAHAGLADVYGVAGVNNDLTPEACYPLAREEAAQALALNSGLAQAQISLAFVQLYFDWDRSAAGASYRTALAVDPNYAFGRLWHAIYLEQQGDFAASLAEIERARMLDPMSAIMNANVARRNAMAGNYAVALAAIETALALAPDLPFTHSVQDEIYFMQGDFRREAEFVGRLLPPGATGESPLSALERGGQRAYLEARLRLARGSEPLAGKHEGLLIASCLSRLGRADEAFAEIEGWLDERRSWVQWLKIYPGLEALHADPRWEPLLARVGLGG